MKDVTSLVHNKTLPVLILFYLEQNHTRRAPRHWPYLVKYQKVTSAIFLLKKHLHHNHQPKNLQENVLKMTKQVDQGSKK